MRRIDEESKFDLCSWFTFSVCTVESKDKLAAKIF